MRSAVVAVMLLLAVCWSPAAGWGHIFSKNRFRPEAAPNWGYGGMGQHYQPGMDPRMPVPREQLLEALLGEQDLLEEQLCEGRRCTANEQCCDNYICGDFDGASGTCMSHQAQRGEGVECLGDTECGTGLMCEMGYCVPFAGKKHYNEPCTTSSECDVTRGLCCQLVRRYRQEPKTLCGYFKDPMICFGHVAEDQVKDAGTGNH